MPLHHRTIVLVLLGLLPLLAACQSPQQRLADANRAYQVEDWAKAYADADAAQRELEPPAKQEAAYIAGMAAFRQDRLDEANTRFIAAEGSADNEVSGKSKAMLGHILEKQGKLAAAAAKYDEAAAKLTGDAAEKARSEAADARARANPAPAASEVATADAAGDDKPTSPKPKTGKTQSKPKTDGASKGKSTAKDKGDDAKSKGKATSKSDKDSDKSAGKGLTIQCGAYPQESQAKKRAKDIADEAKKAGLPAPKVTRVTGRDGKRLWIVTIGSFTSRDAAKKALARLKIDHAEVLPATE